MPEKEFHIPEVSPIDKVFDKAMIPIMWILGGFKRDSIQETHSWHAHSITQEMIDDQLILEIDGDEDTKVEQKSLVDFIFHAPIFGGWKKYVVVGHDLLEDIEWHVGWHVMHKETKETKFIELNKLKLKNSKIKLLKGTKKYVTRFFAFTHEGEQIALKLIDEGIHGDRKHKKLRLL